MKHNAIKLSRIVALFALLALMKLVSCSDSTSNQPATAEGFATIENALKNKFGEDAYYTDLKVVYIKGIGNTVSTTVTKAPESLTMGEWNLAKDIWTQRSTIAIEVPAGTKAADYMFQLNGNNNLTKLGGLVEKSITELKFTKDIENPILSTALIKFPKNGILVETQYSVELEPENGGASFSFLYTLDGNLIKTNY